MINLRHSVVKMLLCNTILIRNLSDMPSTVKYRPVLIDDLISNVRLDSYKTVFNTRNDMELVGVYGWNAHVGGRILPIISAAEIALRNSVDAALKPHLSSFWWSASKLTYVVDPLLSKLDVNGVPVPIANLRRNFANATRMYKKDRKERYHVSDAASINRNGIIAKTEFSTWQFLFIPELMGPGLIWPTYLGDVFRGPWPSISANTTLTYAHDLIKTVREFRNRISHHEPLWKRYGVHTELDAITHLHEKIQKIEDLIQLIHPEVLELLRKDGSLASAYRACSTEEITRFKHLAKTHNIGSLSKLSKLADLAHQNTQAVQIKVYGKNTRKLLIVPIR
jgi:hypothetical protein